MMKKKTLLITMVLTIVMSTSVFAAEETIMEKIFLEQHLPK